MRCQICGRSRSVHFFDLSERTRFHNHALHHPLTLCPGCAESVRGMTGRSEGLYALAEAAAAAPVFAAGRFSARLA